MDLSDFRIVGVVVLFGLCYWIGILVLLIFAKLNGLKENPRNYNAIIPTLVGVAFIGFFGSILFSLFGL